MNQDKLTQQNLFGEYNTMSAEEAAQYLQRLSNNQIETIKMMESLTNNFKQIGSMMEVIAQQMQELANRFDDDGK